MSISNQSCRMSLDKYRPYFEEIGALLVVTYRNKEALVLRLGCYYQNLSIS